MKNFFWLLPVVLMSFSFAGMAGHSDRTNRLPCQTRIIIDSPSFTNCHDMSKALGAAYFNVYRLSRYSIQGVTDEKGIKQIKKILNFSNGQLITLTSDSINILADKACTTSNYQLDSLIISGDEVLDAALKLQFKFAKRKR